MKTIKKITTGLLLVLFGCLSAMSQGTVTINFTDTANDGDTVDANDPITIFGGSGALVLYSQTDSGFLTEPFSAYDGIYNSNYTTQPLSFTSDGNDGSITFASSSLTNSLGNDILLTGWYPNNSGSQIAIPSYNPDYITTFDVDDSVDENGNAIQSEASLVSSIPVPEPSTNGFFLVLVLTLLFFIPAFRPRLITHLRFFYPLYVCLLSLYILSGLYSQWNKQAEAWQEKQRSAGAATLLQSLGKNNLITFPKGWNVTNTFR